MPRSALDLLREYIQRGVSPGVLEQIASGIGQPTDLRPEAASAMTEDNSGSTRRVFCVGYDTVGDANAIVR